jgi:PAS domain S-box-containing protein
VSVTVTVERSRGEKPVMGPWRYLTVAVAVGAVATVGCVAIRVAAQSRAAVHDSHRANLVAIRAEDAVNQASGYADAFRRYLAGHVDVTPGAFSSFAADVLGSSGLSEVTWIQPVPDSQRGQYERAIGRPITEVAADGASHPASTRTVYYPVTLTAAGARSLLGVDLAVHPALQPTIAGGASLFGVAASGPTTSDGGQLGHYFVESAPRLTSTTIVPGFVIVFVPDAWLLQLVNDENAQVQFADQGPVGDRVTHVFTGAAQQWQVTVPRSTLDAASDALALSVLGGGWAIALLVALVGLGAAARRRTREELDRIFMLSRDLICTAGFDGYFKRVNPAFERILGYSIAELLERPFIEFVHEEDRERTAAEAEALMTEGHETVNFQNRYRCKEGSLRWLEWIALGVPEQRLIYATARDVTERKQFEAERERREEALRRSQEQLSTALRQVLKVENERAMWVALEETHRREERRRLASELHDSVSQVLFSMNLHIRALQLLVRQQRGDPLGKVAGGLTELRELTQVAISEMRVLIFQLRPNALEDGGLVAALRRHAAAVAAREGFEVRVQASDDSLPLDLRAETELFRVIQEALHNSVKHAHPGCVEIRLIELADAPRTLVVEVADDGVGFDPTASYPGHLGMDTMRERAERLGGRFTVDSSPAGSTTVRVVLPDILLPQPPTGVTNEPAAGDVEGPAPRERRSGGISR